MILPNRKSIRLKGYDYSSNGAWFITICTQNRELLFGDIIVGVDPCVDPNPNSCVDPNPNSCVDPNPYMKLNNVGEMINDWWLKIPNKFTHIELGTFQIMPNHIHGIIFINGRTHGHDGRTHGSAPTTVGTIIQWFKTMTTNNYIDNVKNLNWVPFNQRIWQRNYYEHIIRNNKEMERISQYITNNPQMWDKDKNNLPESGRINP
ncbi:transposase [Candidatus Daviesbacteria bacterium]|nr:transposase [Candidatus Daviesbacteria bacterium]